MGFIKVETLTDIICVASSKLRMWWTWLAWNSKDKSHYRRVVEGMTDEDWVTIHYSSPE